MCWSANRAKWLGRFISAAWTSPSVISSLGLIVKEWASSSKALFIQILTDLYSTFFKGLVFEVFQQGLILTTLALLYFTLTAPANLQFGVALFPTFLSATSYISYIHFRGTFPSRGQGLSPRDVVRPAPKDIRQGKNYRYGFERRKVMAFNQAHCVHAANGSGSSPGC